MSDNDRVGVPEASCDTVDDTDMLCEAVTERLSETSDVAEGVLLSLCVML